MEHARTKTTSRIGDFTVRRSRVQFENAVKEKLGVSKSYVKRIRKQIEGELYTIQKGTG